MLGKVIAFGDTRDQALAVLDLAKQDIPNFAQRDSQVHRRAG